MFLEFNKFLASGSGNDVLFVSSRGSCSHNFVLSHMLGNALKKQQTVHLICCGESSQFFSLVCQRAGLPFRQSLEKGDLKITCQVTSWRAQAARGEALTVPDVEIDSDRNLVIFDDLLPLLDISSCNEVLRRVFEIKAKVKSMLVIGLKADDPESERLSKFLKSMSTMWVDVFPLSTGYSKEVHGVIELSNINPINDSSKQKMHFKVTERGAKLLVIGSHIPIT
ncbi:uncharacterized protein LOC100897653 [Galendromus occidentalis]|uniref:Elongator complex protein 6 n=1 Tax=Galendromus occidentalis TaxID=34638 RepID=A0AAJ6W0E1_9ACAR|nr:uncharacterized protein LOC100897653 [Galendromus occidentalis]